MRSWGWWLMSASRVREGIGTARHAPAPAASGPGGCNGRDHRRRAPARTPRPATGQAAPAGPAAGAVAGVIEDDVRSMAVQRRQAFGDQRLAEAGDQLFQRPVPAVRAELRVAVGGDTHPVQFDAEGVGLHPRTGLQQALADLGGVLVAGADQLVPAFHRPVVAQQVQHAGMLERLDDGVAHRCRRTEDEQEAVTVAAPPRQRQRRAVRRPGSGAGRLRPHPVSRAPRAAPACPASRASPGGTGPPGWRQGCPPGRRAARCRRRWAAG